MIIKYQNNLLLVSSLVILFLVGIILVSLSELSSYKFTKTCADESSYEEAKKDLSGDNIERKKYLGLDGDKNGRPCEKEFPLEAIGDIKINTLPI